MKKLVTLETVERERERERGTLVNKSAILSIRMVQVI